MRFNGINQLTKRWPIFNKVGPGLRWPPSNSEAHRCQSWCIHPKQRSGGTQSTSRRCKWHKWRLLLKSIWEMVLKLQKILKPPQQAVWQFLLCSKTKNMFMVHTFCVRGSSTHSSRNTKTATPHIYDPGLRFPTSPRTPPNVMSPHYPLLEWLYGGRLVALKVSWQKKSIEL